MPKHQAPRSWACLRIEWQRGSAGAHSDGWSCSPCDKRRDLSNTFVACSPKPAWANQPRWAQAVNLATSQIACKGEGRAQPGAPPLGRSCQHVPQYCLASDGEPRPPLIADAPSAPSPPPPPPVPPPPAQASGPSSGAIAGAIVGALGVVAIAAGAFWLGRKRNAKQGSGAAADEPEAVANVMRMDDGVAVQPAIAPVAAGYVPHPAAVPIRHAPAPGGPHMRV
jgi:hypothetical protein